MVYLVQDEKGKKFFTRYEVPRQALKCIGLLAPGVFAAEIGTSKTATELYEKVAGCCGSSKEKVRVQGPLAMKALVTTIGTILL
jgi:hypothetical protein